MFEKFLKKFSLEERSWIKYDIANSAYTLTIVTVLFPILYDLLINGVFSSDSDRNKQIGDSLFMWLTAFISVIVALCAPILGAMSDFKGYKMKFFKISLFIGLLFGFLMCIPAISWQLMLVIFIISNIGYTAANVFYDSFLTDVTDEEHYNKISSAGYAWGYIGSCVPFILGMIVYGVFMFKDKIINLTGVSFYLTEKGAIAIAFAISLFWWWIYSLPMLRNVKQRYYINKEEKWVKITFSRLGATISKIKLHPKLFYFLLAYFFFIDAVYSIIRSAVKIGDSLNVSIYALLAVTFIVQIIAFPCAIIFGKLAKKFGELKMLSYGIIVYIFICLIGYFLGHMTGNINIDLCIFAALIGSAQGGLQAVSRAYFGKLIPKHESGEYYGFFNIFGRFASIMGPVLMALTIMVSSTRFATLSLIPLLLIGFLFLIKSSKYPFNKQELE